MLLKKIVDFFFYLFLLITRYFKTHKKKLKKKRQNKITHNNAHYSLYYTEAFLLNTKFVQDMYKIVQQRYV